MRLTVLIIVSSARKTFLRQCLKSVAASVYTDYEILIVDNSHNGAYLDSLKREYPSLIVLYCHENTGVNGYTLGFAAAKGKYILVLDDDCTIEPNVLGDIVRTFDAFPTSVGVLALNVWNVPTREYMHNQQFIRQKQFYTYPGGASVFRKTMFHDVGYYDASFFLWLHEDDFTIRLLEHGYTLRYSQSIVVSHHHNGGGFRPKMGYFLFRNKAWFNVKHFSMNLLPALIFRDIIWLIRFPFQTKTPRAFVFALWGYISGYANLFVPLQNRQPVKKALQKQFMQFYYNYRP